MKFERIGKLVLAALAAAAIAAVFCSCSQDIPDGQGLLVIESNAEDLYIRGVYVRRPSEKENYRQVWTAHNIDVTHSNVYLDAGAYRVYAMTSYMGVLPGIAASGFADIIIAEGQTKFLYVTGLGLSE